jgi:MinD superfamily P-loop ATPase
MILTVASGKGGTGKTTVATSFALAISDQSPALLDCDVEAPNAHLFLRPEFQDQKEVALPIPHVDEVKCTGCGRCAEVCQYHAIVVVAGKVLVFPELCHGCGSCTLQCPEEAIEEVPHILGLLESGPAKGGIHFARGILNVGEPMAVPIIRELKRWRILSDDQIVIRDAPPGTSCPIVETMRGSDFVLLVTEPTPFGLHDLKQAVQLTRELKLTSGVVVNRAGLGDSNVEEYCQDAGIPILMCIPMDEAIGRAIAGGKTLVEAFPEYLPRFGELHTQISSLLHPNKVVASIHTLDKRESCEIGLGTS